MGWVKKDVYFYSLIKEPQYMPTLNWIGKDKVVNHHQDVPYRVLDHKYGFTANPTEGTGQESEQPTESGNKIIHGDNLEALKSLLPEYEGKVKCIYIDPPYNTGNESWVYNDNVNHPKIKKWLGEVVGKDGEDLTRHDKWLCMMYPRLNLLNKLLSNEGVIFISIGEDEVTNLKILCDEIFGIFNKCGIVSRVMKSGGNKGNYFSPNIDYVLVYAKNKKMINDFKADMDENLVKKLYNQIEKEGLKKGDKYRAFGLYQSTLDSRPNQRYFIECPDGTFVIPPGKTLPIEIKDAAKILPDKKDGCWRWSADRYIVERANGNLVFKKTKNEVLIDSEGKPAKWNIYTKIWLKDREIEGQTPINLITLFENRHGSKELSKLNIKFDYSKPSKLIEYLIYISIKDKNSIILDSFAGSGTTAHAVLNLNKKDGGSRKFILVEMEDYANNITAERVKRVANGYGTGNKEIKGTGGNFDYYELGLPLFDKNQNLNEQVGIEKIREYIWFSETRTSFKEPNLVEDCFYFLGKKEEAVYYFIYEKEALTTLDFDTLSTIKTKGEQYVIYADNCLLPKEFMAKNNIIFKKIPRDITKF